MSKAIKIIIALIVLILVGWGIFGRSQTDSGPIKIGVIAPLSGPAASIGEELVNAMKLASTSNATVIFEDDACDVKKAVSVYQKLKTENTKVFYVACSGSVIALAPIAKADGNLIVTGMAGSSEIRKTGDEVIRFIPDAISIANEMAEYAQTLASTTKIGILYEEQDYAKSAATVIQDKLKEKILISERYVATDNTFKTQIAKLKAAGVNTLLYIPTSDKAAQIVYKEMQTLSFKPNIIGDVNVCEYPFAPKDFGLRAVCYKAGFAVESEGYKTFIEQYQRTYGKATNSPFYDSISIDIVNIIANSNKKDISNIKKHLLMGVKGDMAEYKFTPDGEVISKDYLTKIER